MGQANYFLSCIGYLETDRFRRKLWDGQANYFLDPMMPQKPVHLVAGGERRQESVFNGLMALDKQTDFVLIHDGVRPFIRPTELWDRQIIS